LPTPTEVNCLQTNHPKASGWRYCVTRPADLQTSTTHYYLTPKLAFF
jgi:hypothetical protein